MYILFTLRVAETIGQILGYLSKGDESISKTTN